MPEIKFQFMQPVSTPHGPGFFIGYLTDGFRCQVAMAQGRKANLIFPHYEVTTPTGIKSTYRPRPETATVSQVVDMVLDSLVS